MADFDPFAAGGVPVNADGSPIANAPATPPAGAVNIPGGGLVTGNPPGFDQAIDFQTKQAQQMADRSHTFANDMYPLFKAQQQLALAPTGAGTEYGYHLGALMSAQAPEWLHRAASYVTNMGGLIGGGITTPEQTTAYAEANKYLTQASLGVAGATRSNEGGATAAAASPSVSIPKPAAQAVLTGMIGLRRMEQDQTTQWQNSGQPVSSLNKFVTDFQTNADPRVYVWDQLPKQAQTQIFESMKPAQQAEFAAKVTRAKAAGIYNNFGMAPGQ